MPLGVGTVDLRQLIELSPKNYYQSIDSRLTSFVDAAAATQQNQDQNDQTKFAYRMNAVENLIKSSGTNSRYPYLHLHQQK